MADRSIQNRQSWQVGQRVSRKDSDQLGTITEIDGKIKVKWDNGQTVARHGKLPPRRHEELPPPRIAEERVNEAGTNH